MKKIILISFCILLFNFSYSNNPNIAGSVLIVTEDNEVSNELSPGNYQQFKHQLINLKTSDYHDFSSIKKRRKSKDDNLMLYVAGGLAVATTALILTNNPENFTSNSPGGVNLGIAIGGTLSCGLFVAKYFIDKTR